MAKKKTKKYYNCTECKARLGSKAWLTRHENEVHPYVPPAPPKQIIEEMSGGSIRIHRLVNGVGTVKIGDSVNIDTKYIVRKTIQTEGSTTLEVELEKVEGVWTKN